MRVLNAIAEISPHCAAADGIRKRSGLDPVELNRAFTRLVTSGYVHVHRFGDTSILFYSLSADGRTAVMEVA